MASQLFADLAWMQRPPADFGRKCRSILEGNDSGCQRLRALANCALDTNQLVRLAGVTRMTRTAGVRSRHSYRFVSDCLAMARSM